MNATPVLMFKVVGYALLAIQFLNMHWHVRKRSSETFHIWFFCAAAIWSLGALLQVAMFNQALTSRTSLLLQALLSTLNSYCFVAGARAYLRLPRPSIMTPLGVAVATISLYCTVPFATGAGAESFWQGRWGYFAAGDLLYTAYAVWTLVSSVVSTHSARSSLIFVLSAAFLVGEQVVYLYPFESAASHGLLHVGDLLVKLVFSMSWIGVNWSTLFTAISNRSMVIAHNAAFQLAAAGSASAAMGMAASATLERGSDRSPRTPPPSNPRVASTVRPGGLWLATRMGERVAEAATLTQLLQVVGERSVVITYAPASSPRGGDDPLAESMGL
ncbi:MAG: hypothetical protein ACOZNI_09895 [Myxococcota bacterium]